MSNASRFYMTHMNAKTGYRATWDPIKTLSVGYVGKLEGGVLTVYSSLAKEGIPSELVSSLNGSVMDYTSHENVTITAKVSGATPQAGSYLTDADAGFSIEFRSERSIVFQTGNHKLHQLVNIAEIEHLILEKYNEGNWDKNWVIVTEVVEADTATIIISSSGSGMLELKANAGVGTAAIKLTDASLGLSVGRERGSSLKYIAQQGITPLYRVMGIRDPLFREASIATRNSDAGEALRVLNFDVTELQHAGY